MGSHRVGLSASHSAVIVLRIVLRRMALISPCCVPACIVNRYTHHPINECNRDFSPAILRPLVSTSDWPGRSLSSFRQWTLVREVPYTAR